MYTSLSIFVFVYMFICICTWTCIRMSMCTRAHVCVCKHIAYDIHTMCMFYIHKCIGGSSADRAGHAETKIRNAARNTG